jgi:hypothetical protein
MLKLNKRREQTEILDRNLEFSVHTNNKSIVETEVWTS